MIFKKLVDQNRFFCLHPVLIMIASDMNNWCHQRNIPFVVTSTVSTAREDYKLKRVSSTHRTCRAIDVRSWVFTERERKEFIKHFNHKYDKYAAVNKFNEAILIIYKEKNPHLHIQIHSSYSKENPFDN